MKKLLFISVIALVTLVACDNNPASVIDYEELPPSGDVARGEALYDQSVDLAPSCSGCHLEEDGASPSLNGYSAVAGERVEDQDAHEYTFYAIVEPGRHIVEGYGNAMYNQYDEKMTPQQIADLIAYLLSL